MSWATIIILLGLVFIVWCAFVPSSSENYTQEEDYQSLAANTYDLETPLHFPNDSYRPCTPPCHYEPWPPGMFNRFAQWHPGYHVHTWSFDKRPGTDFTIWPRNRWVRNNGTYYHIDNGTIEDQMYDYYGRS